MAKHTRKNESKPSQPPTDEITVVNTRYEPSPIAQTMDVDRILSVLREAESGDVRNLMCLYRDVLIADSHMQTELAKRKLKVLGDSLSFLPADQKNQDDGLAADAVRAMVSTSRDWLTACSHLLDSVLWPVSLIEKVYATTGRSDFPFRLRSLIVVPHYLLDYTTGEMRVYDVDQVTGMPLTTTHEADPERYIIHRGHLLSVPDNWGGPMRSILFWWLLSAMDRQWWTRFLERFGSPFLLGKYEKGDNQSKSVLERAFSMAVRIGGLVVTNETAVEIKEAASTQTGDAYEKFLNICQREKSKLILGQTLSAEAQPTGLGSGVSDQQEKVRSDIHQFDAARLCDTLRHQLIEQYIRINGIRGALPSATWASESHEEMAQTISLLGTLGSSGLEIDDPGIQTISQRTGLSLRRRLSSPPLQIQGFSSSIFPSVRHRR